MKRSYTPLFLVLLALAGCSSTAVTFDVTVPDDTPSGASVHVVGDASALAGQGFTLNRADDQHFRGTVSLDPSKPVSFSLRLASPDAAELDATWSPVPARTVTFGPKADAVSFTVAHWDYPVDPSNPPVTVTAKVPFTTPSDAGIYLLGNLPQLGRWVGAGARMVRRPNGQYVLRFNAPSGAQLSFKVTRGAWTTEERGLGGSAMPDRLVAVGSEAVALDLTVYTWRDQVSLPPTLTGDIRYHRGVTSAFLAQPRDLIVYLPPGYAADTSRRYPVLYMHDGQNLMDASTSGLSHTEWSVDEVAQRLIGYGIIEPIIIVGVYNTSDRIAEYTPVADTRYGGGNADAYGRFLVEELKPMIDATYRTKPEAQYTGLAGSSLGGLVSAYFGLTRSSTFGRIAAVSPSVWWANRDLLARVNALSAKLPERVWIDIGTKEGNTAQEEVDNARLLRDAYAAKGWTLGSDLAYLEVPGAEHTESAWAARIDQILYFLYRAP